MKSYLPKSYSLNNIIIRDAGKKTAIFREKSLFWTKSRTILAIKGLLLKGPYFALVWSWKIIKIFLRL
ncbi:hypothetical protein BTI29_03210 [Lactobacillus delbrueckii subsp. bulgaricus]|nr:hypothetical protein [Lactobacillus delbrueckii subsp. bulgaricus]MBT8814251.1 hypothetical protein [Lactobacillus delbrueckii subsp. bulgaricus]